MDALWAQIQALLGLGSDQLSATQTGVRTLVVYVTALAIVRLGSKRFLSKASAFDVLVAIMLGSVMSRAIDGSSPLVPTLVASAMLLGVHWLFAVLAWHTDWFGGWVKGHRLLLIKDGQVQEDGMRKAAITPADLTEFLRMESRDPDPAKIERAYMERNGKISVLPYPREPRVVDVAVKSGVQTVRIEL